MLKFSQKKINQKFFKIYVLNSFRRISKILTTDIGCKNNIWICSHFFNKTPGLANFVKGLYYLPQNLTPVKSSSIADIVMPLPPNKRCRKHFFFVIFSLVFCPCCIRLNPQGTKSKGIIKKRKKKNGAQLRAVENSLYHLFAKAFFAAPIFSLCVHLSREWKGGREKGNSRLRRLSPQQQKTLQRATWSPEALRQRQRQN